jgi:Flp pilus assembly pilin Flp
VVTKGCQGASGETGNRNSGAGFFLTKIEEHYRLTRRIEMEFLKRLCREEGGQGLVEYTFVVVLVALVFWVGIKDTAVGDTLAKNWAKILDCVASPFSCSA